METQTYTFELAGPQGLRIFGFTRDDEPDDLTALVLTHLFTWRRLDEPDADGQRWGWWGDTYSESGDSFGSRLSFLRRAKMTAETPEQVRHAAEEALQPLLDNGIADTVDVAATASGRTVTLSVVVRRGSEAISLRFADLWEVANG